MDSKTNQGNQENQTSKMTTGLAARPLSSSVWTEQMDYKLLSLRDRTSNWAYIADKLRQDVNECQKRYSALTPRHQSRRQPALLGFLILLMDPHHSPCLAVRRLVLGRRRGTGPVSRTENVIHSDRSTSWPDCEVEHAK